MKLDPIEVNGTVSAPPSKSVMQRAVALATLAEGTSEISNPSFCDDSKVALQIASSLGAKIEKGKTLRLRISGVGKNFIGNSLNCGESGLCIRMFTPIAALSEKQITLTGTGSLLKRPISMIERPLKELGVQVNTNAGLPPVKIKGPLKPGSISIDGSASSQFLTGLLMALPLCDGNSELTVNNLKSRDYISITLQSIAQFGVSISNDRMEKFHISGNQNYKPSKVNIEGDWSGAAFILVAGAIAGRVTVKNLSDGFQPDQKIKEVLMQVGSDLKIKEKVIICSKNKLSSFEYDATDSPDLFPPLVSLAVNCIGKSIIHGVDRLFNKESNRATALVQEFSKLGAKIKIIGNSMEITGTKLHSGKVNSHNDHRIAMALAVASLTASDSVEIENSECVSKSYPQFFNDLKSLSENIR